MWGETAEITEVDAENFLFGLLKHLHGDDSGS